jgi:tetratricopeptide (TPR) repeat protein
MHTQTANREAFELVTQAMERLDDYRRDRRPSLLEQADTALAQALQRDPQYVGASFYAGVVKDLIGKAADAIQFFDRILNYLPPDSERRRDEVQYSRGVAWYHQYSHSKLERAEHDFLAVVQRTEDPLLKLLARAGLAQTYAMWMIPNTDQKRRLLAGQGKDDLESISHKRDACLGQIELVRTQQASNPHAVSSGSSPTPLSNSIQGTVLNAHGMCTMYWTDYNVPDNDEKRRLLEKAIAQLGEADRFLPDDWANTCDIGSAHFRLGVVKRASHIDYENEFRRAVQMFDRVLDALRPDYGFAFYEVGRIYRVWGRFNESIANFEKALSIPVQYRDVGDRTVNDELDRALKGDSTFP